MKRTNSVNIVIACCSWLAATASAAAAASLGSVSLASAAASGSIRGMDPTEILQQTLNNIRVTNGTKVPQGSGSSFVQLLIGSNNRFGLCGGTIVDSKTIVTAGHCVYDRQKNVVKPASEFYVFYGNVENMSPTYVKAKKVTIHPKYDQRQMFNDIAIIEVPALPLANGKVETMPLYNGAIGTRVPMGIYGWGTIRSHGTANDSPSSLLTQTVYTSIPEDCQVIEPSYNGANGPQICANNHYNIGVDVCQGDSGTGTTIVAENGKQYLAGLVSYGTNKLGEATCGEDGSFGIYSNVFYHQKWIEFVAGINVASGPFSEPQVSPALVPTTPTVTPTKPPTCIFFLCF
ncbi:hypothetical protein LPJ66_001057 [Kickxella alabastrina]|uniref:Uncharacterized protein n=1 Tax=Kickxella alabastrina TaxID=61397 RepID=A0ACC1IUD9_9FUNG|nr:hypothetical protein LPJ66_001057 [Kickxella alabastrina]